MRRLSAAALLTVLALALPATAAADVSPWLGRDKALHVGASLLVAATGYAAGTALFDCAPARLGSGAALGLAAGLGKELADLVGPGQADWRDLVADLVGIAAGLLVAWAIDALLRGSARACRPRPGPAFTRAPRLGCGAALR